MKVIQFMHNNLYYCASKEICVLSESKVSFDEATDRILKVLRIYLQDKNFLRLKKIGWKMVDNSIEPPIFADAEVVKYAQDFLQIEIKEYNILQIDVRKNP